LVDNPPERRTFGGLDVDESAPRRRETRVLGASAGADRPAHRPAHDVHHLVDVDVGLAALGRRPDAALDVILEHQQRHGVDRRSSAAVCWRMSTQYSSRSIILAMPRTCPSIRLSRRISKARSLE
jgi:hypothetical protein